MFKRIICMAMAILVVLGASGCSSSHGGETEPVTAVQGGAAGGSNGVGTTAPASTEDTTEPGSSDPTASTEAVPEATEAATTEPATPDPTDPEPTGPPATKPGATEATTKPTTAKPAATEGTKHVHKYSKKVVKPTCTKKGYTKYTCSCGDTYKDDYVAATGHDYKTKTVKATCQAKGYTKYTCSVCGDSYKDNYTAKGEHDFKFVRTVAPTYFMEGCDYYECSVCKEGYSENIVPANTEEYYTLLSNAVVKWINYYRKQQGDTEAEILPGLTKVAEYRANQLTTNFAHDMDDLQEAYVYYNYGEWHDMTQYGYDSSYNYYTANAKEAIAKSYSPKGFKDSDIDEFGKAVAEQFLGSSAHWDYVGSSEFGYIGVGVIAPSLYSIAYVCVLQTAKNFG